MIIERLLDMVFSGFSSMMEHFPSTIPAVQLVLGVLVEPLELACYYFGASNLSYVVGNIIFWSTIQIGWAIVEWLYKKIPGVS